MSVNIPALAEAAANFDVGRPPLTETATVQSVAGTRPATPDPVGPAFQGLSVPATAPTPPGWRTVDISTLEWDGSDAALGEPGREGATVPRVLPDYTMQQKSLAATQAAAGLDFTDFLPQLRKATSSERLAMQNLHKSREALKAAGGSETQLRSFVFGEEIDRLMLDQQFREKVTPVIQQALGRLAAEEQKAVASLAEVGVPSTEADYAAATNLSQTLDLMPPAFAVPLLRARLVEQPVKSGQLGLVQAMIPLLQARVETDKQWNASDEARDLLMQCQLVLRTAKWYAGHMRLSRIHALQWKISSLAEDYTRCRGDEQAWGYAAGDAQFYADLGVSPSDRKRVK